MNIIELNKNLLEMDIPRDSYSLGSDSNESLCLVCEGELWSVYYSEKGTRTGEKKFYSENEACNFFLKRIKSFFT